MDLVSFADCARIPNQQDKVFNDECLFSYDTPESPGGLYICMEKFLGFGRDFVEQYHKRTDNRLFLHIQRRRVPKKASKTEQEVPEKVSKMAINVPGGFQTDDQKFDFEDEHKIVLLPEFKEYPLTDSNIPMAIQMGAKGIINAESALKRQQLEEMSATWEGEQLVESKYAANLEQLNNGVKIPPKGWKCQRCDLRNNLWLNLTDGSILCGRKYFDGSGGNNHALDYYAETKYPLAVKLGTITPEGKGDVFSYPEDNLVLDPKLVEHLAHFGINVSQLTKTDKSMVELEIDFNQRMDYSAITESGSNLVPVYGKGLTGMLNLGNTCYMNSILQMLFTLDPLVDEYVGKAMEIFNKANLHDPLSDFKLQMAKVGFGLWSGRYSNPSSQDAGDEDVPSPPQGIRPAAFKTTVARGHPEFSTNRQQDAHEFFMHLLNLMEKAHVGSSNPAKCMQFEVEDRIECGQSGKVKYKTRVEDYIPLPIPMSDAINKEAVAEYEKKKEAAKAKGERLSDDELVRAVVPFEKCIESFLGEVRVEHWKSPVTNETTFAKNNARLLTTPDYLLIQLKKFDLDNNWVPFKLDVEVTMPDELDISVLRKSSPGLQQGEEEMPDVDLPPTAPTALVPDQTIVNQLMEMGFNVNGCKRAAVKTKNSGVEAAMNWVIQHMEDPDFAEPFVQEGASASSGFTPEPEKLASLLSMGMPEKQSIKALKETDQNVERAIEWIFSHPDDDGTMDEPKAKSESSSKSCNLIDGPDKYRLAGFVSHIGSSVHVGHYVCHLLKDGKWTIFNDEKVALSEKPPKTLGYFYLYQRIRN